MLSDTLELDMEVAAPVALPCTNLLNPEAYEADVADAVRWFKAAPTAAAAIALTIKIVNACFDHVAPGVSVCVNCSWGKDSSAMLGVIGDVMLERQAAGLKLAPVIVAIAHTGNEFVAMELRIEQQNALLKRWAEKHGFDVTIVIGRPHAKNSLIALLAGAGYALPSYSQSARATSANWCVDRLKIQSLSEAIKLAKGKSAKFLQFLGVRKDESTKRGATIDRYSEGMPTGLSRIGSGKGDDIDRDRLAVQPIAHWTHDTLKKYLRESMAVWDAFSFESLKAIYRLGANDEDLEGASECSITRTSDGGMSTVCSDLGGARFGCMLCIRSKNASLLNMARRDRHYVWINAVHKFIYNGIRQHKRRMSDIKDHGFQNETMFCKGYTFQWRYTLLMWLYRAEIESGFTLVDAATEAAIKAHWERSGIVTVTPADARRDAAEWKATGKLRRSYDASEFNYESLSLALPDGLPVGAYAYLRNPDHFTSRSALSIANMMVFAGRGGSFFPQLKAYVFKDHSARGGFVTMLSDVPSDMGKKLNTDALSGYEGFSLELIQTRDLTSWERRLLRGRIVFYRHQPGELETSIEKLSGKPFTPGTPPAGVAADLHEILMANIEFLNPCGEKALIDDLDERHLIGTLAGTIDAPTFKTLYELVADLTDVSEILSERHDKNLRSFRSRHRAHLQNLRSEQKHGDETAREFVTAFIKESFSLTEVLPAFEAYLVGIQKLKAMIDERTANTELVNKLAYIVRTSWYDDRYAETLLRELLATLRVKDEGVSLSAA